VRASTLLLVQRKEEKREEEKKRGKKKGGAACNLPPTNLEYCLKKTVGYRASCSTQHQRGAGRGSEKGKEEGRERKKGGKVLRAVPTRDWRNDGGFFHGNRGGSRRITEQLAIKLGKSAYAAPARVQQNYGLGRRTATRRPR